MCQVPALSCVHWRKGIIVIFFVWKSWKINKIVFVQHNHQSTIRKSRYLLTCCIGTKIEQKVEIGMLFSIQLALYYIISTECLDLLLFPDATFSWPNKGCFYLHFRNKECAFNFTLKLCEKQFRDEKIMAY